MNVVLFGTLYRYHSVISLPSKPYDSSPVCLNRHFVSTSTSPLEKESFAYAGEGFYVNGVRGLSDDLPRLA